MSHTVNAVRLAVLAKSPSVAAANGASASELNAERGGAVALSRHRTIMQITGHQTAHAA